MIESDPRGGVPASALRARAMYSQGRSTAEIKAATGLNTGMLYFWLDGGPLAEPRLPAIPRRRTVICQKVRPLKGERVSLIARLWKTAESHVRDIELRLAAGTLDPAQRARDVRALGQLTRMMRDLAVFQAQAAPEPAEPSPLDHAVAGMNEVLRLKLLTQLGELKRKFRP